MTSMIATHMTTQSAAIAILKDGMLKPADSVQRKGWMGFRGLSEFDQVAGDGRFIFFSTGDTYMQAWRLDRYFFAVDARLLIERFDAAVGPGLGLAYDQLARRIFDVEDALLPPKPGVSDESLDLLIDELGLKIVKDVPEVREKLWALHKTHVHELRAEFNDLKNTSPRAVRMREQFQAGARILQERVRKRGRAAMDILEQATDSEHRSIEILIEQPVPVDVCVDHGLFARTYEARIAARQQK